MKNLENLTTKDWAIIVSLLEDEMRELETRIQITDSKYTEYLALLQKRESELFCLYNKLLSNTDVKLVNI